MSAADGSVRSTTQLVNNGPASRRWNLVIMSEGFKESQLKQFHTYAQAFVDKLAATVPFDEMWHAINVFRVDVASRDSGADHPVTCRGGVTVHPVKVRTYFDARYCWSGDDERLLAGNEDLARTTAKAAVNSVTARLVIVNDTLYGGAGGTTAFFSLHPDASNIGLHELGHSAFKLEDEYGDAIQVWDAGEPPAANVTTITDRPRIKWHAKIHPSTPLPTVTFDHMTDESPVSRGTVGLFEGGARTFRGIYHPEFDCRMNHLAAEFCSVCRDRIRFSLKPYLPVP